MSRPMHQSNGSPIAGSNELMHEWLVFETGPETKRLQGAVLGLQFDTNFASLSRIRVECDLVTADLNAGTPSLYVLSWTHKK